MRRRAGHKQIQLCTAAALITMSLTACASLSTVENLDTFANAEQKYPASSRDARYKLRDTTWAGSVPTCDLASPALNVDGLRLSLKDRSAPALATLSSRSLRLSAGDVVNLLIQDGDEFNGDYTLGPDGSIALPFIRRVHAVGLTEEKLAGKIQRSLVAGGLFSPGSARVAIRVVRYAAVKVRVRGAVFQSGLHTVNQPRGNTDEAELAASKSTVRRYGDFTIRRSLSSALSAASGVRPDADVADVHLIRRGVTYRLDMSGALTGNHVEDPALEGGDEIFVPSKNCFQSQLVRPSAITPRGVRIFVSKQHFAADSRYDEQVPYGHRLLQAAVVASCVGGIKPTRGHREIVLVSRNPETGATEVVQRSVETLVRHRYRDSINPFLMPGDAVACYDSAVVEAADFASILSTILSPAKTFRDIQTGSSN